MQRFQTALNFLKEWVNELANKPTTNTTNNGGGGDDNTDGANKENNSRARRRKTTTATHDHSTWTKSMKYDQAWSKEKQSWFNRKQRDHKFKTDAALKKSDIVSWEAKRRSDFKKQIERGKKE